MSNHWLRLAIIVASIALFIGAVEWKKNEIRVAKAVPITTILSELIDNGAPVRMATVGRQPFANRKTYSLSQCGSQPCLNLSRQELNLVRSGARVYHPETGAPIGRVQNVASSPSFRTGLFEVSLRIASEHLSQLRVIETDVGAIRSSIVVPIEAVMINDNTHQVYVVNSDLEVELVSIETSGSNSQFFAVRSGLREGDTIITEGQSLVSRFGKINVLPAETEL